MPHNVWILDQTCPKTGRYSIKKFLHHLLFSLKCYLGFSGSGISCELGCMVVGYEKKSATNKNMERRRKHKIKHVPKKEYKKVRTEW